MQKGLSGFFFCCARSCLFLLPFAAQPRPAFGGSKLYMRGVVAFPGHALHEKGLQRQKGFGPLVGSQEQRALLVPVINRGSTARQPLILFPHSVCIGFRLFVLLEKRSREVSSIPWGVRGTLVSWENCSVGVPSCPARPRRSARRPDPIRPWYVRVLDSTGFNEWKQLRDALMAAQCFLLV